MAMCFPALTKTNKGDELFLSHYTQYWSETEKLIATCLVCSDKTAAAYAAEIWIKGVQEGTINSSTIGRIIGVHQQIEFIPLKRLNDLIISQLLNISPVHNKALEVMVRSLLIQLPAKPVKHLKKLVQVFFELRALNNSGTEDKLLNEQVNRW